MDKAKVVLIAAACGFVLSLVVGLFSHVSFGILILRALLFAALFALFVFGVRFVFERFLGGSVPTIGKGKSASAAPAKGQFVDINVADATLPDDDGAPSFRIPKELMTERPFGAAANGGEKGESEGGEPDSGFEAPAESPAGAVSAPQAAESPAAAPSGSGTGFTPPPSLAAASSGEQAKGGQASAPQGGAAPDLSADDLELGSLPEMDSMLTDMQNGSDEDIIVNSDFAKSGETTKSGNSDTEMMAKAIHTVLVRDNS